MRIEILKYLSDTHEYKPLNDLLKSLNKSNQIVAIRMTLLEMYTPGLESRNVIELRGDYGFLGLHFVELEGFGKALHFPEAPKQSTSPSIISSGLGDLDNCPIQGRINYKGKKELEEYELQESIKSVNDSVIRTNKVTLIIAGLAAFFSLMALLVPIIKPDQSQLPQLQETNRLLQRQVQIIDSQLQKQIVSDPLRESRKDSLNR